MLHIGLDMHKRQTAVAVLDDAGAVLERRTLGHDDPASLRAYFAGFGGDAVATVEATRSWYWFVELLEEVGLRVKLAHPLKVRLIAEARVKTDRIDAEVLAQLERTGFLPESYIPAREVRDRRELLRYRLALVGVATGLKNRVHALLDKLGVRHDFSDLFGKGGREFLVEVALRPVYRRALDGCLACLDRVTEELKGVEREIRRQLEPDERAERLMTIPGVGRLTAYLLLAEIGEVGRFLSAKRLCAYAGLVPRTSQSGDHCYSGRITRQGNAYLRWAMVEAAQKAAGKDPALSWLFNRLRREKGSAKARVAVARKLLVAVYYILKDSVPYRYNCLTRLHLGKPACASGRQN